jgi:hypothetical protein
MKSSTLFEGIVVALIGSFIGSIIYYALSSLFSDSFLIRLLISGLSFGYILYLLNRSKERIGRITVIAVWSVSVISLWFIWPPITLFILMHVIAIWLVRSLYFYSNLFSSLADLALNGLSIAIAFWAAGHTGSLFLTIWCFFLTQALFVLLPTSIKKSTPDSAMSFKNEDEFQKSYRAAEAAVRKLSTN